MDGRRVLIPYARGEAVEVSVCAAIARVDPSTIRRWARVHALGRKIGGRVMMSRVGFAMFMAGDLDALATYHTGDRTSAIVRSYFDGVIGKSSAAE